MRRTVLAFGCVIACSALPAAAQPPSFLTFTPAVLPAGATDPVLIEAELSSQPTRIAVEFSPRGADPTTIAMRDDGGGGDRIAGDNIYSARLPATPILSARADDDVFRVPIGFLDIFMGSTRTFRGNLFVDVYGDEIGTFEIARLSQFVQATAVLVNIHDPAFFLTRDPRRVTQELYRAVGDDYDVLNLIYSPQRFENRTHFAVKNQVRGIGLALLDNAASYGSGGRLQGISQFPIAGGYDGAGTAFNHELGHQWVNFLSLAPFMAGIPHWPISEMATGLMGFSIGGPGGQGGDFPCAIEERDGLIVLNPRTDAPPYNDLDLYLMGLLPAGEVRSQIVFADQAAVAGLRCTGQTFTGPITRVDAQTIIERFGLREPPYGEAPASFRSATVLVTRDGLATPEMMWLYSWMTERAEWRTQVPTQSGFAKQVGRPFHVATRGRATIDVHIDRGQPDFALVPADADASVAPGDTARYSIRAQSRRWSVEREIAFSCGRLPEGAACRFEPASVRPGEGGAATALSIATNGTPPGRYVVLVNATAGDLRHVTAISLTVQ